ncbi:hypothetical protein B0H19DRAFT_962349 [Mycena capillaripes]|nr:hypothetical protein B0H19DRAFT_962349 [Mycena capillaripes]
MEGNFVPHPRASELCAATVYTKAELWIVHLANFASVKAFTGRFERQGGRLDIFVENAAISMDKCEWLGDCVRFPTLPFAVDIKPRGGQILS